jgi:hypothetical protein
MPLVRDRHRSREFIEILKLLDDAYRPDTAIKVPLDITPYTSPKKPGLGSLPNRIETLESG